LTRKTDDIGPQISTTPTFSGHPASQPLALAYCRHPIFATTLQADMAATEAHENLADRSIHAKNR